MFIFTITTCLYSQSIIEYRTNKSIVDSVDKYVDFFNSNYTINDSLVHYIYINGSDDGTFYIVTNSGPLKSIHPKLLYLIRNSNRMFVASNLMIPIIFNEDCIVYINEQWIIPGSGLYIEIDPKGNVIGSGVWY